MPKIQKYPDDEERIKTVQYLREVEELLEKETSAKRVFIFDHTIRSVQVVNYTRDYTDWRRRRKHTESTDIDPKGKTNEACGPVELLRIDWTYEASVKCVYRHLGQEAERL